MLENIIIFLQNILRRPYVVILIAIYSLSSLLLILLTSFYTSLSTVIDELDNVKEFKIIEIDNNHELLDNISHIENKYKAEAYSLDVKSPSFNTEDLNGAFSLYAVHNNLPDIIYGNTKLEDNKMEMICPINFFPLDNRGNNILIKPINIREFLNKNIPIKFNNEKQGMTQLIKLKLTGIYFNNKLINDESICYVNYKTMEKITNNIYNLKTDNLIIEIDSVKNIEKVKESLKKQNINYKSVSWIDLKYYQKILDLDIILIIVFCLILIFIVIFITEIVYNRNINTLVLYYNVGYSTSCIIKLYIFSNLTLWILSTTITTLLTMIYNSFSYNLVWSLPFATHNFTNVINMRTVLYVSLLSLFITICCTFIRILDIRRRDV